MKVKTNGIELNYEVEGSGPWITLSHSLACNISMWDEQMELLTKRFKVLRFDTRGHGQSSAPAGAYTLDQLVDDVHGLFAHLGIRQTHWVGLSMGGFAALHFGLDHADRARSVVVAGAGYGAEKQFEAYFRDVSMEVAKQFETQGSPAFAKTYSLGASRVQFQNKDPRGWQEFATQLGEHSAVGAAARRAEGRAVTCRAGSPSAVSSPSWRCCSGRSGLPPSRSLAAPLPRGRSRPSSGSPGWLRTI
jgi:pimeloyl-ACP methyl ester carboxylesterase